MAMVKVYQKGQLVMPKAIRDKLGIKPGSLVEVSLVGDHAEVRPLPDDPIGHLTGIFRGIGGSMAQELLEERKQDDKEDEANCL